MLELKVENHLIIPFGCPKWAINGIDRRLRHA
jgi:hypothetical protein